MNASNPDHLTTTNPESLAGSGETFVGLPFVPGVVTYTLDELVTDVTKMNLTVAQVAEVKIIAVTEDGDTFNAVRQLVFDIDST